MPGGNTHFNSSWLDETDSLGHKIRNWCRKSDKSELHGYCFLCQKEISCSNRGLLQIKQHAEGDKHRRIASAKLGAKQSKLISNDKDSDVITCLSHEQQVANAEILWAYNVARHGYSFNSCEHIQSLFAAMFPGYKIAQDMTLGPNKLSYLISDGLGPLNFQQMLQDVRECNHGYMLAFDESPTAANSNQLDIHLRYWSETKNQVVQRYYKSFSLGHKPADKVASLIMNSLREDKLPLKKFFGLMMDGPFVNLKTERLLNDELIQSGFHGLVDLKTCVLHIVHNSFRKGIEAFGTDCEDLVIDLFYYFKSAAKREDYAQLQRMLDLPEHTFLKHSSSRWLTILPVLARVLEQFDGIVEFFLKKLPVIDKQTTTKCRRYKKICDKLNRAADMKVQLNFLISTGKIFERFLTKFQSASPLIHELYDEVDHLLRSFLLRFIKTEALDDVDGVGLQNFDVEVNHLSDSELEIGDQTRKEMKAVSRDQRRNIYLRFLSFYKTCAKYMQQKLPLDSRLLRDLRVLSLKHRGHTKQIDAIRHLGETFGHVIDSTDQLVDEWKVFRMVDIPTKVSGERIDCYWKRIFDHYDDAKFPLLTQLVKTVLAIGHGSGDVERGFSTNSRNVTNTRTSLSDASINGLRTLQDMMSFNGVEPHEIQVTRAMRQARKSARASYLIRLDEEKKQKEEQDRKAEDEKAKRDQIRIQEKEIKDRKMEVEAEQRKATEELGVAAEMLSDANVKINKAISSSNVGAHLHLAQVLAETAQKKMIDSKKRLDSLNQESMQLSMRLSKIKSQPPVKESRSEPPVNESMSSDQKGIRLPSATKPQSTSSDKKVRKKKAESDSNIECPQSSKKPRRSKGYDNKVNDDAQLTQTEVKSKYVFSPPGRKWQSDRCTMVGIPFIREVQYGDTGIPLSANFQMKKIIGDGNCLYRSLSFIISGSEEHHAKVRAEIAKYERQKSEMLKHHLWENETIVQHLENTKTHGKDATDSDVLAAAALLDTPIYVYQRPGQYGKWDWNKYRPDVINMHSKFDDGYGLYIINTNSDHFDVAIALEP